MQRGLAVAFAALVLLQGSSSQAVQRPSVAGAWTIDRSGSDDPEPLAAECKTRVRGPGGHAGSQQLDTGIFAHPKYKVLSETELYRLDQTMQLALDDPFSVRLA